jgi:hypothetical protein
VGGRHVDQPHTRPRHTRHQHALVSSGRPEGFAPTASNVSAAPGVARILDAHTIAGIQEQACDQVEPLLHAGDNRNLFRDAHHVAGVAETR